MSNEQDADPDRRAVSLQSAQSFVQACRDVVNRIELASDLTGSPRSSRSAREASVLHFETSALTGEHTEAVFEHVVRYECVHVCVCVYFWGFINLCREVRKQRKPVEEKSRWCFLL